MYIALAKEVRELNNIISTAYSVRSHPFYRCKSYFDDYLKRLGILPVKIGYQPLIDRFTIVNVAYNNKLTGKKVDLGRITMGVSYYDEMRAQLPAFMDSMEAKVRPLVNNDKTILDFLYFTNRKELTKGPESDQLSNMDNWILRFHDYPVLNDEELEITSWVTKLKVLWATKDTKKTVLVDDRSSLEELRYLCFDAILQNLGTLLTMHSSDINKILDCHNTKLLKPNEADPERYLVNQFPMYVYLNQITTSIEGAFVKDGAVIFDNSKNSSAAWVWLSVTTPTGKADYAILVEANSTKEIKNRILGPEKALYLNCMFVDIALIGKLKITVKKK